MTDGDSMTINNLRDSANGTFVTLDDYLLLTFVRRFFQVEFVGLLRSELPGGRDRVLGWWYLVSDRWGCMVFALSSRTVARSRSSDGFPELRAGWSES